MNNGIGAVIYVRVSTDEQADGALNLKNQEQKCRNYCDQKGYPVTRVFVDPGESARTADRPEFLRMLAYCKVNRREVGYVIVQDLSRFARNNGDQSQFISELGKHGVKLCSVYEPSVDDTAAGKLAANIHGTFNQFFSDALSEKMKDRMRAAVLAGRFPWPAPLGYLNNSRSRAGANLVPDPERAPLVRKAFELIATGNYRKTQALQIVTDLGLRTRRGGIVSARTFDETLKKPVYCGYVNASFLESPIKAAHEPIISETLYQAVQDILGGRRLSFAPKRKQNPQLPLKWFVRCDSCGTRLTGMVTGKNKNHRFGYYWCRNPSCRSVMIRNEQLENIFLVHLGRLRPDEQTIAAFPGVAEKVWTSRQDDGQSTARKLSILLEERKRMKSELLRSKLRGEVSLADYAQATEEFDREIIGLEGQLEAASAIRLTLDAFLRFAKVMLLDIAGVWKQAAGDQKVRVQNLLFQGGLRFSQELRDFKHLNPCLFSTIEVITGKDWWLASPTGFEPVLPP